MSEATGDRPSNPKGPGDPGSWMDQWGACKVCGGEIPQGHTDDCDVFKMEMELRAYQECEKLAAPLSCPTHGLVPNLAWFNSKCPNCKVEQLTREVDVWKSKAVHRGESASRLRAALEPFAKLHEARTTIYQKRGGNPDSFPDSHPAYDITASQLRLGIWRRAAEAYLGGFSDETKPEPDVGALNRQLCEAEGHVFSRFAMHHCLRCEAAVTPGGYLAYTSSQKVGERPRVQPPKFCAVDGCYNRVADDQEVCDSCSQNGKGEVSDETRP